MTTRVPRWARWLLRASSLVVPAHRRLEWMEEWTAEVEALARSRRETDRDYPSMARFVAGALPHALWMRKEEWTMESVAQDVRFAARVLRRSPGFTAVAALTLALGIGANASIFSLVNGMLLRAPQGIAEPDRLVQIARSYDQAPRWDSFSWPAFELIRSESRGLSGVAGFQDQPFVLGRGAEAEQVLGQLVSGNFFEVLGARPYVGRLLRPSDDVSPGAHAVVVLSHALWTRRFGGDPEVVGQTIHLGGDSYEVVGVAAPGLTGVETIGTPPALWVPTMQHPPYYGELPFSRWGWSWIDVIGRLDGGVSFQQARASMDVVTTRLRDADSVNEDIRVLMAPGVGLDPDGRRQASQLSLLLAVIVGLVLLLTCTNVANLFLARATGRGPEFGVRVAIGAGRARLGRQILTESLLLAVVATLVAVPVVYSADRFLPALFPYALAVPVGADLRVYAFLVGIGLLAGLLFGAVPAWVESRRALADVIRDAASSGARRSTRVRDALVVGQLGLSLGLVSAAALLGRSVLNAHAARPGFEPEGLVVAWIDPAAAGREDEEEGRGLYRRLLDRMVDLPGIQRATLANQAPVVGGHSRSTVMPPGREDVAYEAERIVVGPEYFEGLGIPILRGRGLGGFDDEPEPVVVVNEALADRFWPGEDPVGKILEGSGTWRVVGVAGDVQMRSLRQAARPAVYYPLVHLYQSSMVIHLRSEGSGPSPVALRQAVAEVDPDLPVAAIVDLRSAVTASMGETRTLGFLVGAFAGLALLLAAVGLYGLVSFGAAQRVREMGIRIALGARPDALVRLMLRRGLALAVIGVMAGLGVSWLLGQALAGLLFGIPPDDPLTLSGAALLLLATAALAAWIPARRVARVDPAASLRD
jgi:putative ABC transport system permease protein